MYVDCEYVRGHTYTDIGKNLTIIANIKINLNVKMA